MYTVTAISGSPSSKSKTTALADYILKLIALESSITQNVILRDLDSVALTRGDFTNAALSEAVKMVATSDGIVIATPIFKAAYSGLLKCFLDILPQFAFAGKIILPVATGGSLAHVLALDYALRPVAQSMGARQIVQSYFLPESDIESIESGLQLKSGTSTEMLKEAIFHFRYALSMPRSIPSLGHPRPIRVIV